MKEGDVYVEGDLRDPDATWQVIKEYKKSGNKVYLVVNEEGEGCNLVVAPATWTLRQRGGVNVTSWVPLDQTDINLNDEILYNGETYRRSAVNRVVSEIGDDWVELTMRVKQSEVKVKR